MENVCSLCSDVQSEFEQLSSSAVLSSEPDSEFESEYEQLPSEPAELADSAESDDSDSSSESTVSVNVTKVHQQKRKKVIFFLVIR